MRGNGENLGRIDFRPLRKFFDNIDFLVPGHEGSNQYMVAIHQEFYRWAGRWVGGKSVLDAGCGEGFGSAILAERAAQVMGIDIKPDLLAHARRRYPAPNLTFELMDCEAMSFPPAAFDVVVCNELVEHLRNYRAFLDGAYRALRAGGTFVCATTNAEVAFSGSDGAPLNRHHYQEFQAAEFQRELGRHFAHVQLFAECMRSRAALYLSHDPARWVERLLVRWGVKHKVPVRWRNFVRERMTGVRVEDFIAEGFEIVEGTRRDCLYIIGVGRKA
ncbi:MAG: class I SAM-dependent methyltransferase [Anaerolineales bacterium]